MSTTSELLDALQGETHFVCANGHPVYAAFEQWQHNIFDATQHYGSPCLYSPAIVPELDLCDAGDLLAYEAYTEP